LEPKDHLFATLDVTTHGGVLPSCLKVLYVDTVGFISDIPSNLIESFVATLEDAMLAVSSVKYPH
jgi:50S ribosomal subunit-associated GTPase HflX